jgi:hypothetical protein
LVFLAKGDTSKGGGDFELLLIASGAGVLRAGNYKKYFTVPNFLST